MFIYIYISYVSLNTHSDWDATAGIQVIDSWVSIVSKIMQYSPWYVWIQMNAIVHLVWVGALLICQMYQVSYLCTINL